MRARQYIQKKAKNSEMTLLRLFAILLAAVLLLPFSGCCAMARAFCGPDKSPWVPQAYDTPQATLTTFLEALRRDNPDQVLRCLAESFKQQHGLNSLAINVAWQQLHAELPYLHMAGYVSIPSQPSNEGRNTCSFELMVDGKPLRIDLGRQSYLQVIYRLPDGSLVDGGRQLSGDAFATAFMLSAQGFDDDSNPQSSIALRPIVFAHPRYDVLPAERLARVTLGSEWKIKMLTQNVLPD